MYSLGRRLPGAVTRGLIGQLTGVVARTLVTQEGANTVIRGLLGSGSLEKAEKMAKEVNECLCGRQFSKLLSPTIQNLLETGMDISDSEKLLEAVERAKQNALPVSLMEWKKEVIPSSSLKNSKTSLEVLERCRGGG